MSAERLASLAARACVAALLSLAVVGPAGSAAARRATAPAAVTASRPVPRARQSLIYAGPPVEFMVVGAGNVILQPSQVSTLPGVTVSTSHGSCGVASGLPLDALAVLSRLHRISFTLQDYGHCTAAPASSGQLFVNSIDGERNHGLNGWEYKVDGRSGTAGAADPAGPFGNGGLKPYAQLLWFWCQSFGGGCQRSLELRAPKAVRRNATFTVTVVGLDNNGSGEPMSGARVSAGAPHNPRVSAVSGGSGRVSFRAPSSPGTVTLNASRPGSVPSFPVIVQVR
jgi:hypothetical protein